MMEDSKYYIPTIDEFYVGFEFEYYENNKWNYSNNLLESLFVVDCDTLYTVGSEIENKTVRVKYLDQEDIESLGFTLHSNDGIVYNSREDDKTVFSKYLGDFAYLQNMRVLLISRKTLLICIYEDGIVDKPTVNLFRGIIKNKSELIKLLKQLGI